MIQPRRSTLPTWTPEREARALRLFLREGLTAAEVAHDLGSGFSRAAVIGKIRRLGFRKRDQGDRAPPHVAKKPGGGRWRVRLPPQRPPLPMPSLREVPPTGEPCRLACLPANGCRWPIDHPGAGQMHAALFCAGPTANGPYCPTHRALAYAR